MKDFKINLKGLVLLLSLALIFPLGANAQYYKGSLLKDDPSAEWDRQGLLLNNRELGSTTWTLSNDGFGAPLGGGIAILIAAGAGYAVVRRKRSRKNTMLLLACVALLGFAQCKKEEPLEPQNEVNTIRISLKTSANGGTRHTIDNATGDVGFEEHDVIYVGNDGEYIGTLECNASGVFEGEINEPADNTEMYFYFVGGLATTPAELTKGTTASFTVDISDQSSQMPVLSCNHVTYKIGTSSYSCSLHNQCALVKFVLAGGSDSPVHVGGLYTEALIDFGTSTPGITHTATTGFVNLNPDASDNTAKWAVLLPQDGIDDAEVAIAHEGYTADIPTIEAGGFITGDNAIAISTHKSNVVYLDWLTTNYAAGWDLTLTGTLVNDIMIEVYNYTIVTLRDVTINGTNSDNYPWAGITCRGDTKLVLEGTNNVTGFYQDYPGVSIAYGKDLTIEGSGTLNASSNGRGAGIGGGLDATCGHIIINGGTVTAQGGVGCAGIGAAFGHQNTARCGGVTINGGNVTAIGGKFAAGIGSGCAYGNPEVATSACGNVTISGGTVVAIGGADGVSGDLGNGITGNDPIAGGAGIGTGSSTNVTSHKCESNCGYITIGSGVTSVTAIKGSGAANSIGQNNSDYNSGFCGAITIGGTTYIAYSIGESNYSAITVGDNTYSIAVTPNQSDGATYIYPEPNTTVVWNSSIINSINCPPYPHGDEFSYGGITVNLHGAGFDNNAITILPTSYYSEYELFFSSTVGKMSKIEISYRDVVINLPEYQGWSHVGSTVKWEDVYGATDALLSGVGDGKYIYILGINQIIFTLLPE